MFGLGANEILIILVFGFLIFGPDKLPGMAKTIGQMIARFRSAQAEMSKVIKTEVYDPDSDDPFKNPLDAISKLEQNATREDRAESFTARKARYDKQRAAKKAAELRKVEREAKRAAEAAEKEGAGAEALAAAAAATAKVEQAKKDGERRVVSADELYATKTVKKGSRDDQAGEEKKEQGATGAKPAPADSENSPAIKKDKKAEEALDEVPEKEKGE